MIIIRGRLAQTAKFVQKARVNVQEGGFSATTAASTHKRTARFAGLRAIVQTLRRGIPRGRLAQTVKFVQVVRACVQILGLFVVAAASTRERTACIAVHRAIVQMLERRIPRVSAARMG